MDEPWIPRRLRLAGVAAGGVAAIPVLLPPGRYDSWAEPGFRLWAALAIGFLALFWWLSGSACDRHGRRVIVGSLAVLSLLALGLIGLGGSAFGGVYPVLAMTIVGGRVSRGPAGWWAAAQGLALLPAFRWAGFSPLDSLVLALVFGGLSLFVLYTARVTVGERAARRELEATNRELREARDLLERRARDAERLEIARELHDVMGHHLTALSLSLEAAVHGPADAVTERVSEAQVLAKRLLRDTRKVVSALRSEPAEGLEAGLRRLAAEVRSPILHLELGAGCIVRDATSARALLRCAQEIVTNAVRHSGAENLWIAVARADGRLTLEARDDGRGAGGPVVGHGLSGMQERVRALGGDLSWRSGPQRGFSLELWIPLSSEALP